MGRLADPVKIIIVLAALLSLCHAQSGLDAVDYINKVEKEVMEIAQSAVLNFMNSCGTYEKLWLWPCSNLICQYNAHMKNPQGYRFKHQNLMLFILYANLRLGMTLNHKTHGSEWRLSSHHSKKSFPFQPSIATPAYQKCIYESLQLRPRV